MQIKVIQARSKERFEEDVANFMKDNDVKDIKFSVSRNFLPYTTRAEKEEIYYAMLIYEEKE